MSEQLEMGVCVCGCGCVFMSGIALRDNNLYKTNVKLKSGEKEEIKKPNQKYKINKSLIMPAGGIIMHDNIIIWWR